MWAGIHSVYAFFVAVINGTVLRQQFRPSPHSAISQILPALLLVAVLGIMFSLGVAGYAFGKAIAGKERKLTNYFFNGSSFSHPFKGMYILLSPRFKHQQSLPAWYMVLAMLQMGVLSISNYPLLYRYISDF